MNRRKVLIGALVTFGMCLVLVTIITVMVVGDHELAKQRWKQTGGPDYTLVVSETCYCGYSGIYFKLAVHQGQVVDVEVAPDPYSGHIEDLVIPKTPANLAYFDKLTVEGVLIKAGYEQFSAVFSPWFRGWEIAYDPVYGYVTTYYTDRNGIIQRISQFASLHSGYSYTARDLQFIQP